MTYKMNILWEKFQNNEHRTRNGWPNEKIMNSYCLLFTAYCLLSSFCPFMRIKVEHIAKCHIRIHSTHVRHSVAILSIVSAHNDNNNFSRLVIASFLFYCHYLMENFFNESFFLHYNQICRWLKEAIEALDVIFSIITFHILTFY